MVPKNLTQKQNNNLKDVYLDLLERFESDSNFMKYVIMDDKSWIYEYYSEKIFKMRSGVQKHVMIKKAQQNKNQHHISVHNVVFEI